MIKLDASTMAFNAIKAGNLSKTALTTITLCRLEGEDDWQVIDRLLTMLLPIAPDIETFFGPQTPNVK